MPDGMSNQAMFEEILAELRAIRGELGTKISRREFFGWLGSLTIIAGAIISALTL